VVNDHYMDLALPAALRGYGPLHHMGEGWLHNTPLHLVLNGAFAVTILFVLSGIVLSAKFFRTKSEPVVAASAAKRYVRLALPALGSVLIACLLLKLGLFSNHQSGAVGGSTLFGDRCGLSRPAGTTHFTRACMGRSLPKITPTTYRCGLCR
jgi:hypothetical protein